MQVQREANAQRRHAEQLEESRLGRAQESVFRREEIELKKQKVEAGERQGAEINEVKQDLAGVKATVGALAETVQRQGEKQALDSQEIKALLLRLANRG